MNLRSSASTATLIRIWGNLEAVPRAQMLSRTLPSSWTLSLTMWRTTRRIRPRRTVWTQAKQDSYSPDADACARNPGTVTPKQLVRYLDEFVIGQENAKKVLSVAVFNHYNRVRANFAAAQNNEPEMWAEINPDESRPGIAAAHLHPHPHRLSMTGMPLQPKQPIPLFEKSNVLVIGPTGSGKTLLVRTLARILDVPFSVSDATSFTQVNVGEDVDTCVQRLLQAADWDPSRASTGIVYIDEVDKIGRKSGTGGPEGTRDVGGEGVQQALLRMMEGSVVSVQAKGAPPEANLREAAGSGRPETFHIDTSNVLFILSGAFVGLDNVIKRRVAKGSIGFGVELPPVADERSKSSPPFFTSNKRPKDDALDKIEPEDTISSNPSFSFIPEFISRLPSITTLSPLSVSDLRRILTDVKGSLISQYTALFGYSGVEIRFTSKALDEICRKASDRGGGARGLRGIMETLLLEPMYETIRHVLITDAVVRGEIQPLYWQRGEGAAFWNAWAEEETQWDKNVKRVAIDL
ncbi:ClpX, ATPase regulatory subunit [Heliocybe sulcata]|uniref:ClpX, ATPase regulatory subunit n=1 Tax=Heliocybe sulcata TaxID=5364 RepID=A0A5C3NHA9_9AGAM|nr:ClpX, ATPase regulatory subunit [Heliocybe sulcata]